jgi:hypothetical protein
MSGILNSIDFECYSRSLRGSAMSIRSSWGLSNLFPYISLVLGSVYLHTAHHFTGSLPVPTLASVFPLTQLFYQLWMSVAFESFSTFNFCDIA